MYKILIHEPCFSLYKALANVLQVAGYGQGHMYAQNERLALKTLDEQRDISLMITPAYWGTRHSGGQGFLSQLATLPKGPPALVHSISHMHSLVAMARAAKVAGYIFTDSEASIWIKAIKELLAGGDFYPELNKKVPDDQPYVTTFEKEALGLMKIRAKIYQNTQLDPSRIPSGGFYYKSFKWGKRQLDMHWKNIYRKYRKIPAQ